VASEKIAQVLAALQAENIQAIRGYPGNKIAAVVKPVAAVSMNQYTDRFLTLAVDVLGPTEFDGSACENLAVNVAGVLTDIMATCTVGNCEFSGKTGLFSVRVLARWYRELGYAVDIDDETIAHVTACRAEKDTVRVPYVDSATGDILTTVDRNVWTVTITDIWPLNEKLPVERTDAFTLFVMRPGGMEAYIQCVWEQITLEETPAGVLRTRVAKTYQDRTVGEG
jgi:hypothetical protein